MQIKYYFMLLDLIRAKKISNVDKGIKVSACKAITWRILGTIDTIIISFFLTGNFKVAFSIGGFEVFSKMVLYFLHERAWAKLTK